MPDPDMDDLFGPSGGSDPDMEAIFGSRKKKAEPTWIGQAADKFSELAFGEWDWFKKLKEGLKPEQERHERTMRMDEPDQVKRGLYYAGMGDQGGIGPMASAEFAGQFIGSPGAMAGTAASLATGGTSAAAKLALLGKGTSKLAPLAAKAAPIAAAVGKYGKLADRGIAGVSAISQGPALVGALREGEIGKAIATGAGIGMNYLGSRAAPELPDVARVGTHVPQGLKEDPLALLFSRAMNDSQGEIPKVVVPRAEVTYEMRKAADEWGFMPVNKTGKEITFQKMIGPNRPAPLADVVNPAVHPMPSHTLENPSPRNLEQRVREGYEPGALVTSRGPVGQVMEGDDRVSGLEAARPHLAPVGPVAPVTSLTRTGAIEPELIRGEVSAEQAAARADEGNWAPAPESEWVDQPSVSSRAASRADLPDIVPSKVKPPERVYHGTQDNFKEFDDKFIGEDDYPAHYFTEDSEIASHYAGRHLDEGVGEEAIKGANVRPSKLNVSKPFDMDANRAFVDSIEPEDLVAELKKRGYDSFTYMDPGDEYGIKHRVWGVFEGKNVKSSFDISPTPLAPVTPIGPTTAAQVGKAKTLAQKIAAKGTDIPVTGPGNVQGPLPTPGYTANVTNRQRIEYAPTKLKVTRRVIRDEEGLPILGRDGKKQYEVVRTTKQSDPADFETVFKQWAGDRRATDIESAVAKRDFEKSLGDLSEQMAKDHPNRPEYQGLLEANLSDLVGKGNKKKFQVILDQVKPYFDKKYGQLVGAGKRLGYREDYIPQLWTNTKDEVDAIFGTRNARLSLKKNFEFKRVLENYAEGIEKGLTPKFEKVSDLVKFYEGQANKAIADKNFFEYLKNSKLISDTEVRGRKVLDSDIFPVSRTEKGKAVHWSATPEVHEAITRFLKPDDPNLLQRAGRRLKASALSAGIPYTGLNIHGAALAARDAWSSEKPFETLVRDVKLLSKPETGAKFVEGNLSKMPEAVRAGLGLTTEHIKYRGGDPTTSGKFFSKIEEVFEDPLFQKAMPAMKLQKWDELRQSFMAKGLDAGEAGRLAATQTNEVFGNIDFKTMITKDKSFEKGVQYLLGDKGDWFLAPQWLASQGYIGKGMAKALQNPLDPRGMMYNRMARNLAITHTYANVTNKVLSGHWMGENEDGKFLEIDTGQTDSNGKKIYIAPFGTGAEFVRLPVEAAVKIANNDVGGAVNMVGSKLSPIPAIGVAALSQKDWRGDPIKGVQDYPKLAWDYAPPYVKHPINYLRGTESLPEAAAQTFELPFRFRKPKD